MRFGDLEVTLIPTDGGQLVEQDDQTVLARPGQVYGVRVTNHAAGHRAVVTVAIDGLPMTERGLLLDPAGSRGSTVVLERPTAEGETGRFTFVPEGDEAVFGEGGGRDNPDLGLVRVEHRRELAPHPPRPRAPAPAEDAAPNLYGSRPAPILPGAPRAPIAAESSPARRRAGWSRWADSIGLPAFGRGAASAWPAPTASPPPAPADPGLVEGAGGTGLTGHSGQTFIDVQVGRLEETPTVITLRLVLGRAEAFGPRPLPGRVSRETPVPPRPAPRP